MCSIIHITFVDPHPCDFIILEHCRILRFKLLIVVIFGGWDSRGLSLSMLYISIFNFSFYSKYYSIFLKSKESCKQILLQINTI